MDDFASTYRLLDQQLRDAISAEALTALAAIASVQRDLAARERDAVRAAAQDHSWAAIGQALGVSKQAAHQKFAKEWALELRREIRAEHVAMKTALREGDARRAEAAHANRDSLITEVKNNRRVQRGSRSRLGR